MTSMRLSCPTRTLILPSQNNAAKGAIYGTLELSGIYGMYAQVGKDWLQHPLRSCPLGADTEVIFIDVKTGVNYAIPYITSGTSETIKLEKGKWYSVETGEGLTMSLVNVRIE